MEGLRAQKVLRRRGCDEGVPAESARSMAHVNPAANKSREGVRDARVGLAEGRCPKGQ